MTTTIREQIIAALIARLGDILIENGYRTDCGDHIEKAKYKHAPDDPPMIIVFPRPEDAGRRYGQSLCEFDFDIEMISLFAEDDDPVTASEAMLADAIKCLTNATWLSTQTLFEDIIYTRGGTDRYPESGESTIGVQVTFSIKYETDAGDPYSQ